MSKAQLALALANQQILEMGSSLTSI